MSVKLLGDVDKGHLGRAKDSVTQLKAFMQSPGYDEPFDGVESLFDEDVVRRLENHPSTDEKERRGFVVACQRDGTFTKVHNMGTLWPEGPTVVTIRGDSQYSFLNCVLHANVERTQPVASLRRLGIAGPPPAMWFISSPRRRAKAFVTVALARC